MVGVLNKHREVWEKKKIIREIYTEWYQMILADLKESNRKTVELGAGGGNFKEFKPDVISADIEPCNWLDMCFDAHEMPFGEGDLANIVMIDVLHHLANPIEFLSEAYRTLEPGGRLIMLEPYPSPSSLLVYKLFHPEPFIFKIDYFSKKGREEKDHWDSNQAIPYLIFYKGIKQFESRYKGKFKVIKKDKLSYILYALSGGFENKQLIPDFLIPVFKLVEKILKPFSSLLAFRCYIVLEKV